MSKLAEVKGQAAHLEARECLLDVAKVLESTRNESDAAKVFAGAVRAYLEAEKGEPCLHLHTGKHVACECEPVSVKPLVPVELCGKELTPGHTCTRSQGHRGPHVSRLV
jgi:hypothetical protein